MTEPKTPSVTVDLKQVVTRTVRTLAQEDARKHVQQAVDSLNMALNALQRVGDNSEDLNAIEHHRDALIFFVEK